MVHFHLSARPHPTGAWFFFRIPLHSVPSRAGGASVSSPPDLRPLPLDVKGSEHSFALQRCRALPERHRPHLAWSAAALHCLASVPCGMANSTAGSTSIASLGSPPPPSGRRRLHQHRLPRVARVAAAIIARPWSSPAAIVARPWSSPTVPAPST